MLNVVWFKRDLRITDHEPLLKAVEEGIVAPLFIVEPEYWAQSTCSARQWRFVSRTLAALRTQLAVLGAPLIVRVGDAVEVLEGIRANTSELKIWSHEETGDAFCRARHARVSAWAQEHKVIWHETPQQGVRRCEDSRDGWIEAFDRQTSGTPLPAPDQMLAHGFTPGKIVSERILYLDDDPCTDLAAGPAVARRLLRSYLETGVETGSDGPSPHSRTVEGEPRISAHVSWGTISLREIRHQVEAEFGGRTAVPVDAIMNRLRFRTDLTQRIEDQPELETSPLHSAFSGVEYDDAPGLLAAWREGQTGLPIVDATMRALAQTGWIEFEFRVAAMSAAVHLLRLDWRTCGPIMASLLTNYEPGVHWNMCQMAARTTGFADREIIDPNKTGAEIDPSCAFVREWVPELRGLPDEMLQTPWKLSAEEQTEVNCIIGADYPAPAVDFTEAYAAAVESQQEPRSQPGFEDETRKMRYRHISRGKALGAAAS